MADGSINHCKARFDAKEDGIDYTEKFSPFINPISIRVILALVVHFYWPNLMSQMFYCMALLLKKCIWNKHCMSSSKLLVHGSLAS